MGNPDMEEVTPLPFEGGEASFVEKSKGAPEETLSPPALSEQRAGPSSPQTPGGGELAAQQKEAQPSFIITVAKTFG